MRIRDRIVEALTRSPRGFLADGRPIGVGLATAMEKARQDSSDVEEFLRRSTTERERVSS